MRTKNFGHVVSCPDCECPGVWMPKLGSVIHPRPSAECPACGSRCWQSQDGHVYTNRSIARHNREALKSHPIEMRQVQTLEATPAKDTSSHEDFFIWFMLVTGIILYHTLPYIQP
jgi:hypothetical protein